MLDKIKNKHILIDGDIIKYRCAASAEKTKYLMQVHGAQGLTGEFKEFDSFREASTTNGILWSRKEVQPLEFALQACKTTLESLLAKLSPTKVSVFLSPDRTFRHDCAKTKPYKGNRVQPKPKYLKEVEKYLVREYGAVFGDNIEADDEIGIALSRDPGETVSVSIDKDLLQVPGWHYNWVNDTIQRVTPKNGDFSFYSQMLTGDTTDNIPGIAGIGPQGAGKILSGAGSSKELCSRVWSIYRAEFNDSDSSVVRTQSEESLAKARSYFMEQAQLLYILRGKNGFTPPIELKEA